MRKKNDKISSYHDESLETEYLIDVIDELYPKIIFMRMDQFYCFLCVLLRLWHEIHNQNILIGADIIRNAIYQDVSDETTN